MPKRRSLVGTGREAIGETPARPRETAAAPAAILVKRARKSAPKPGKPRALPLPPQAPEPVLAARESASAPGRPKSVYDAMAEFARTAMRQNLETGARLAGCKSPVEILAAQTAHAASLAQSFFAISMRLMQLSLSTATWGRRE